MPYCSSRADSSAGVALHLRHCYIQEAILVCSASLRGACFVNLGIDTLSFTQEMIVYVISDADVILRRLCV